MPDAASKHPWWRPLLLGVLAVAAYQFGFHIYVLSTIEPGSRSDGLAALSVVMGTPIAIGWAVVVMLYAERVFDGWRVPTHILLETAIYALAVVVVFVVFVTRTHDQDTARYWLDLVTTFTAFGTVTLPLTMFLYYGSEPSGFLTMLAIGIPSVGPILFLMWRARRTPATS